MYDAEIDAARDQAKEIISKLERSNKLNE